MTKTNPADLELVRELALILDETKLTEVEVERGDLRVRITRQTATHITAPASIAPVGIPPASIVSAGAEAPAPLEQDDDFSDAVTSPMVGTVYMKPSPEDPAFIKVGDQVQEGDTLLLVEAMKTFNPIPAPKSGKIHKILVSDAEPVEYGAPLVVIV